MWVGVAAQLIILTTGDLHLLLSGFLLVYGVKICHVNLASSYFKFRRDVLTQLFFKTRRMFVIETASRACKITILIKRSKVRKVNHAFLPKGIQIEDLTQASCHA